MLGREDAAAQETPELKAKLQQSMRDIFDIYFNPQSPYYIPMEPKYIRKVENYVKQEDPRPKRTLFKEAQKQAFKVMKDQYLSGFLSSESYANYNQKKTPVRDPAKSKSKQKQQQQQQQKSPKKQEGQKRFSIRVGLSVVHWMIVGSFPRLTYCPLI